MNKNPYVPTPAYPQPPLPPGPPPGQPPQADYSAYWAQHQQGQWNPPQPAARPAADQSALYANYGYGHQQNNWQRQQQQQQQHQQHHQPAQYHAPPQPVPPAQPYNPYQPAAGYPQPYAGQQPQAAPQVFPPQPPAQHQQYFPQQNPPQQPRANVHHSPVQHMPPAKRQRFDGPPPQQRQNQSHQGQGFSGSGHGGGRGGSPQSGRGGMAGNRGGMSNNRGGRGSGMNSNRGGSMGGRSGSRGGGSFVNNNSRGGNAGARSHGSKGNFSGNKDFHNRRSGGSFANSGQGGNNSGSGSFRSRNSGHQRSGRHDGALGGGVTFGSRNSAANASFTSAGGSSRKDENRRTLTDFKLVALEMPELNWTWVTPHLNASDKAEVNDANQDSAPAEKAVKAEPNDVELSKEAATATVSAPDTDKDGAEDANGKESENGSSVPSGSKTALVKQDSLAARILSDTPPPSRIRIYFHTPVSADDSHAPLGSVGTNVAPGDSRKGKRKKSDDDDGDVEERRARPPPPQRSEDRGSMAPSVAETASEGDWLMAAIADENGDGDDYADNVEDAEGEQPQSDPAQPDGFANDADEEQVDSSRAETSEPAGDEVPAVNGVHEGVNDVELDGGPNGVLEGHPAGGDAGEQLSTSITAPNGDLHETASTDADIIATQLDDSPSSPSSSPIETTAADSSMSQSTLVNPSSQFTIPDEDQHEPHDDDDDDAHSQATEQNSPPPERHSELGHNDSFTTYGDLNMQSYTSGQTDANAKPTRIPSANRLSISYAGGTRRLVIDSEVVDALKVFRKEGRIEISLNINKDGEDEIRGILLEILSPNTKSYSSMPSTAQLSSDVDPTFPPFADISSSPFPMTLIVRLDTERPLSEPKWVKSGDINDWLKSMFGGRFWVAGAAEGWERKITVADPDPPPTIFTVLEGWQVNSPVGMINERQRFIKTHMTETDNILEILLRLVRGERATPFSQSSSGTSSQNLSGPLLTAMSQNSDHGAQQTHVSLAVMATFRMAVDFAKKAVGEAGKADAEQKMGEIIRSLPSHLIYKSLDGIFKEWRVEKKGH